MRVDDSNTEMAKKGRNGDTHVAHVADGEMVVPPVISDELRQAIYAEMIAAGLDPAEFTVGDGEVKINPETGEQEFFFKKLKKIVKIAAPAALAYFAPGIGTAIGSSILGAGAAGASTLGGALLGAGTGLATGGGLKGALLGGIAGGISPNLGDIGNAISKSASGALDSFGQATGLSDILSSASGALGDGYKTLSDSIGNAYEGSALQDIYRSGGEALKSAGFSTGSDTTALSASPVGGGASSYTPDMNTLKEGLGQVSYGPDMNTLLQGLNSTGGQAVAGNSNITPILSALMGTYSNDKAEKALLAGQRANQQLLAPYANGFEFTPGDLTQDPGYQFNLQQGNQAMDRAQLARGGFFSGNALKEAQTFGQGLADNTYNTAFQRALQGRNAGLTGALASTGVNTDIGNIKANSATNTGNLYSGALGSLFGGDTYTNTGALQGGRGNDLLTMLLKQQYAGAY